MERSAGSRLQTLFQQLEKIGGKQARNQTSTDDVQTIRYVTSKIYQILSSQEKLHRDTVIKNTGWVELVLATLKNTSDRTVLLNTVQILAEMVGKTQVGKRASVLVSANATNILFQLIYREAEDQLSSEETMMLAHFVLGKLAQKDRKFATKARLNLVLLITLNLIKNNLYNFKNLQSLLQVFKAYTNNSVNASYLGKQNSIPPMFRVIQQCGRKHTAILKLALDILTNLTKSSSGRKALADANGIQILYDSAQEVIDCREMESLILLASVIMRKCCPRNKLPLDKLQSAFTQELPESELYPTGQDGMNEAGYNGNSPDSDNSSLEEDDDIDSDDERFKTEDHSEEVEDDASEAPEPYKRTPEDLRMYDTFFPELFEIEPQEDDDEPSASIYIPTGNVDSFGNVTSDPDPRPGGLRMPTATSYTSSKSSGYSSLHYDNADYESYGANRSDSATAINLKTGTSVFSLDGPLSQSSKAPPPSAKPKLIQKSNSSSSSSLRKAKGNKKMSKEKKKKSSSSSLSSSVSAGLRLNEMEAEYCSALCITPFPSSSKELDLDREGYSSEEEDMDQYLHCPIRFQEMAGATKSVFRFEKLAYPDLVGGKSVSHLEGLYHRKFGVQRVKVFEDIDRMIHPEHVIDRVVYDVDTIVARASSAYSPSNSNLSNRDQMRIGSRLEAGGSSSLRFNSQFESGNLRKAIWVREFEYDLILNPDVNTNHHHQWFYFEVSNMIADVPYRFNIVNCEKLNSQFNFGMKPVMFSVSDAMDGKPYWFRTGSSICYYKNHFTRSAQATGGVKGKTYYTATFTVTFKNDKDICYLAYHYPYTFTTLQTHLSLWEQYLDHTQIFFRKQTLCNTITGNGVPVLTITAQPKSLAKEFVDDLRSRPYIFLSGRVHPGESNSSWVMKGTIDFLLSKRPAAQLLRETFIFKIVPMLNPDGVINGCHRCSTGAEDLNRRWDNPCPRLHPTIYHSKGLLQYMQMIGKVPLVFCDYHGHSRRKNIFIYGCCPTLSYIPNDTKNPACTGNKTEDNSFKTLPRILHLTSPVFSWQNCSFVVEKAKETTARVVVWRQIGVIRSYTMESSYCGIDKDGKYKDQHISTFMLEEMGHRFCEGLLRLRTRFSGKDQAVSFPFTEDTNSPNEPTQGSGSDELLAEADEDINLPDEQNLYGAEDEEYDEDDDDELYEDDETYDDDRN
ncbi:cytosolic carboxypeptidase 1-like isoform X2 [Crassostrea virginica]